MGWNYLALPKRQRLHSWSLGMDSQFNLQKTIFGDFCICDALIYDNTNMKTLEQLIVWFYFYWTSNKTHQGVKKLPKLITQYIKKKFKRHINIGIYTYFLLWLSPCDTHKTSMMRLWHTELLRLKSIFVFLAFCWVSNRGFMKINNIIGFKISTTKENAGSTKQIQERS